MNSKHDQSPARETTIHPGALVQSGVFVGPGCQISAEAVIELHTQLERNVTVLGQVHIGRAVKIDADCTLVGPLEIEAETILYQGVSIGTHIAENIAKPLHTILRQGVRVGSGATIYGGLELGEASFVQAHSRLTGDLPAHCLAEGDPAALHGFICPCGGMTEIRLYRRTRVEITYLCTVCRQTVTVLARLVPTVNHVLLPGGQAGELVHFPDWKPPHWAPG